MTFSERHGTQWTHRRKNSWIPAEATFSFPDGPCRQIKREAAPSKQEISLGHSALHRCFISSPSILTGFPFFFPTLLQRTVTSRYVTRIMFPRLFPCRYRCEYRKSNLLDSQRFYVSLRTFRSWTSIPLTNQSAALYLTKRMFLKE